MRPLGRAPLNDVACARDRILVAAARLYALQGYAGTSMRAVADAAEVTKPLVYYHFGSKENLYGTLLRESIDACRAAAHAVQQSDAGASDRLRAMLRAQFAHAREAPEAVAFAHEVMTMPGLLPLGFDYKSEGRQLFDMYVRVVEDGQERGEFRPIDPRAVVMMAIATVAMHASAVLAGEMEAIPEGAEDVVFDLVLRGVGR